MNGTSGEEGKNKKVRRRRHRRPKKVTATQLDAAINELENLRLNVKETTESKKKAKKARKAKKDKGNIKDKKVEEAIKTKNQNRKKNILEPDFGRPKKVTATQLDAAINELENLTLNVKETTESKKKAKKRRKAKKDKRNIKAKKVEEALKTENQNRKKNILEPDFGQFEPIIELPFYHPSEKMKDSQTKKFSMASLVKAVPTMKKYIDSLNLQPDNINGALQMLLEIEDLHTLVDYVSLYQRKIRVKREGCLLKFNIKVPKDINIDDILSPEMDQVVFVPISSTALSKNQMKYAVDLLWLHKHERQDERDPDLRRHVRTLKKIQKNTVYVNLNEDDDDGNDGGNRKKIAYVPPFNLEKPYDIIFRPSRYTFRVQRRALDLLDKKARNFVFPNSNLSKVEAVKDVDLEIINKQICENAEQLQAVKQIVGGPNPHGPYIVVGPPGTGKTTTIVEAILQLYMQNKSNHILIAAGSNSACDTVALKICQYFENESRLVKISTERSGKRMPPHDILRVFSKSWIKNIGYKNINPLIKDNANFSCGEFVSPSVEALRQYNIIVVTLCTMGRLRTGIVGNWPFTHVFIDEASAITEAEALVAITSVDTRNCRVILSGDTKQLGPVVMSRVAGELGLKHSLMERLLKRECYAVMPDGSYDRTLQTRLRRNYRSHPEILKLFNNLYYNNELIAKVRMESLMKFNKLDIVTNKKFPIIFEAVQGKMGVSENSKSSYNQAEVDKVLWIIYKLKNFTDITNIGIVSPYRLQCAKIKKKLKDQNLNGIEVGTAELYQGREKPIMIASFVKSFSHLGFVTDPQRLNVMLSRAQSLLILVGNPGTLQKNKDFKYLIDECKRMGTFHKRSS